MCNILNIDFTIFLGSGENSFDTKDVYAGLASVLPLLDFQQNFCEVTFSLSVSYTIKMCIGTASAQFFRPAQNLPIFDVIAEKKRPISRQLVVAVLWSTKMR